MSIFQKILSRFGYYRLESNRFYYTDDDGVPYRTYQKIGDSFYSGYKGLKHKKKDIKRQ